MLDSDDDNFNNKDDGVWSRFWNKKFDGEPLWYIAAMAALPFYFGLLITRVYCADVVLPWVLGFMIAGAMIMVWASLRGGR